MRIPELRSRRKLTEHTIKKRFIVDKQQNARIYESPCLAANCQAQLLTATHWEHFSLG